MQTDVAVEKEATQEVPVSDVAPERASARPAPEPYATALTHPPAEPQPETSFTPPPAAEPVVKEVNKEVEKTLTDADKDRIFQDKLDANLTLARTKKRAPD